MWLQKEFSLSARTRGFHLVTQEIVAQLEELRQYKVGLLHLFIKHTSASLSLNENADPTVRDDLEAYFRHVVPDGEPYYTHTYEGPDDITAHIKTSIIGAELSIPISNGKLKLGSWRGIYLCEHRNHAHSRTLVATINGQN